MSSIDSKLAKVCIDLDDINPNKDGDTVILINPLEGDKFYAGQIIDLNNVHIKLNQEFLCFSAEELDLMRIGLNGFFDFLGKAKKEEMEHMKKHPELLN